MFGNAPPTPCRLHVVADDAHWEQRPVGRKTVNPDRRGQWQNAHQYGGFCVRCFRIQHGEHYREDGQGDEHKGHTQSSDVKLLLIAFVVQDRDKKSLRDKTEKHAQGHEIKRVICTDAGCRHAGVFDGHYHEKRRQQ